MQYASAGVPVSTSEINVPLRRLVGDPENSSAGKVMASNWICFLLSKGECETEGICLIVKL